MPEISERDFAALAAEVASLSSALAVARRRIDDLEEGMTDHLGLDWGESLVDVNSPHPNISANTIESGGGLILQNEFGMQVAAETAGATYTAAVYFLQQLMANPTLATEYGIVQGYIDPGNDSALEMATLSAGAGAVRAAVLLTSGSGSGSGTVVLRLGATDVLTADANNLVTVATLRSTVGIQNDGWLIVGGVLSPAQITSDQNDYSPTNWLTTTTVRLSTDASRNITGLDSASGSVGGVLLLIFNVGSFDIVLKDEDAGSTAANRFALQADITVPPDGAAILWYDSASSRWRCVGTY